MSKGPEREKIALDTAAFLESGGVIEQVDHTRNASYVVIARRTRKQQVRWMRKFGALRSKATLAKKRD